MDLPEPNLIRPTAENVAFARAIARANFGVPLPGEIVAGRELDALIAEKVMGWRNWTGSDQSGLIGGTWSPSTSIDAAWQVLGQFGCCHIEVIHWGDSDTWQVNIGGSLDRKPYRMPQEDWAETAPLAICRAALAAVGH